MAVIVTVFSAFKPRYFQQRRAAQAEALRRGIREKAEKFNSYRYIAAEGSTLGNLVAEKLNGKSLQLSERQFARLKSRLPEVFTYLGDPSFERYQQLKSDGFKTQVQLPRKAEFFLERNGVDLKEGQRVNAANLLRPLWDMPGGTKRLGHAKVTALCLENFRARSSHTNTHQSILGIKTGAGITAVDEAFEPGFRYAGQTNAVSYEHAGGLFFQLAFLGRSNSSSDAGPMFLSMYWSEPDQNWAPSRLFVDQLLKFNVWF